MLIPRRSLLPILGLLALQPLPSVLAGGGKDTYSNHGATPLPPLFAALKEVGASKFAEFLQSDPKTLALYSSGLVRTVFAPADECYTPPKLRRDLSSSSSSPFHSTSSPLLFPRGAPRKRDLTPEQQAVAALQGSASETGIEALGSPPGKVVETVDNQANIGGANQSVVSNPLPGAGLGGDYLGAGLTRRGGGGGGGGKGGGYGGGSHGGGGGGGGYSSSDPVRVNSGLGDAVTIIKPDIKFDGGLIQLTDGFFTLPQTLSCTLGSLKGTSQFAELADCAGLASTLDKTPRITVFIPTDAALAAAGLGKGKDVPEKKAKQLVGGHVVKDFLGYLPNLVDGECLTTSTGKELKVSVKDCEFFIDDAKIVKPNIILENGVAHIIDKVLNVCDD